MDDVARLLTSYGAPVFFAGVLADQLGAPLPGLLLLLAAGALGEAGLLHPAGAFGLAVAAAMLANLLWFEVGRRHGQRVLALVC
ncbi:MAG TPA: sulfurtransferase, partial [Thermodesulfobacteriota bacterium]